jgi:formate hydrogenlyase subunit 4
MSALGVLSQLGAGHGAAAGAAADGLGQPVAALVAKQVRAGPVATLPHVAQAVPKESLVAEHASQPCSAWRPMWSLAACCWPGAIVPTLSTDLPLSPAADAIAWWGLFALARVFISLAAMDVGTAFGTLGARREMLVGFLAEPALLMVLFCASMITGSTSLTVIVETLAHRELDLPQPAAGRCGLHHGVAGRERPGAGG